MPGPLPEILEQPVIPPPLHGVNPRTIMGRADWDRMRRAVCARHGYRCAACGVASRQALFFPRLEAHERFSVDYRALQMHLIGIEPLCHACHSFVHGGLMEVRIATRQMSRETAITILSHGVSVLSETRGKVPVVADKLCRALGIRHGLAVAPMPPRTPWKGWRMRWEGRDYASPYPSEADWRRAMRARSVSG
ncbi:hypothetical protein [Defluviimonas salinarum]|uniref:HNH endonuclease n=1 Tax=Defluviimonas salinarum TaxID=2992147 RepID=A0ABT3J5M9_9RHOB|nr:hypothetical protein [Defluviimonas salinarum]MCW3783006.1 hypothetical protein [Defluviimonas salinarum]